MSTTHCRLTSSTIAGSCLLAVLFVTGCATAPAPAPQPPEASTIVFVHGAWGGGWQFRKVAPLLEARGYTVYRPTMTGLGERVHLAGPEIGLATHLQDIVNVLEFEDLHEVVLVGHSYGGMVISGIAERVPARIAQLVYLDAILPEDGDSVLGLFGDGIDRMASRGGEGHEDWQLVPRWVAPGTPPPVDVPQPIATFTDAIALPDRAAAGPPATFILTVEAGRDRDDFDVFAARARDRGWPVVRMQGDHNPHWFQPGTFVEVLVGVINAQSR